jgi:hypothetical protein
LPDGNVALFYEKDKDIAFVQIPINLIR